ncbi:hypothetical protein PUNSTDRAFT_134062 [Punctularia strigosozonata HHB-11173 SS5]|uniref:uncharacterized protein n=1 Tax=Punctularia strigosozonata (strain HHB-11173) TaxID=741275 RepID=UPI000441794F|nr:uncharacterized protein PUNSTDRAFT_134062 [Punctularia strigosozonata HHB-11173 SS5]EIN08889.1 hypothetical protein PUNSTDRAFT_134062 [Punctularia strigosozonata HHB-11173 SS5]
MLILCAAMPQNVLWIAVDMFYAKICSNSLFASLNAARRYAQVPETRPARGIVRKLIAAPLNGSETEVSVDSASMVSNRPVMVA